MSKIPAEIQAILAENNVFTELFDIFRLVDPVSCSVQEIGEDGLLRASGLRCTQIWGAEERCQNCTSVCAFYTDETMVKLETLKGSVLLIFSVPVAYQGVPLILEMIKDITASVQRNAESEEMYNLVNELNRIATTDSLTGVFNRRYMRDQLPGLIKSNQRNGYALFGALMDLDDFKKINDVYGHAAGDRILIEVGKVLSAHVRRASDWVARYGGEEFFVCFPGTSLENGLAILEKIRQRIQEIQVFMDDDSIHVTVSIGASILQWNDDDDAFLARCDALLYKAKRGGKNRIEFEAEAEAKTE